MSGPQKSTRSVTAGWRAEVLREFTPGVARLTVVDDPDGLLEETGLVEALRVRGFEAGGPHGARGAAPWVAVSRGRPVRLDPHADHGLAAGLLRGTAAAVLPGQHRLHGPRAGGVETVLGRRGAGRGRRRLREEPAGVVGFGDGRGTRVAPQGARVATRFPGALEWPASGLPENYLALLAPARRSFVRESERPVAHGGVALEEVVVPFVAIERSGSTAAAAVASAGPEKADAPSVENGRK